MESNFLIQGSVVLALAAFIAREVWGWFWKRFWNSKDEQKKEVDNKIEKLSALLEKHFEAMNTLSHSMVELKVRIGHLEKTAERLGKIETDVNYLHNWRRALEEKRP